MAGRHIPEDTIVEILSRLPVKSLLRFRCVSKRWRSIVSDPQFAKLQFKVTSEQKTLRRKLLFSRDDFEFESLDLETKWNSDNPSIRKLPVPFKYQERSCYAVVVGSCNGLVCVETHNSWDSPTGSIQYYIWNPSTEISHKIPDPGLRYVSYRGFGYLPATDDYKILLAAAGSHHYSDKWRSIKIFSTRAGLWKRIEKPSNCCYNTSKYSGVLLGKTLHWEGYSRPDVINIWTGPDIFAFDLEEEKFREIPRPSVHQDDGMFRLDGLDSCGGCLYGFFYRNDWIELWVMREYGVRNSWTKLFNLQPLNWLINLEDRMRLSPLLASETSTVVLSNVNYSMMELVRIGHEDEQVFIADWLQRRKNVFRSNGMFIYEESLLQISDYPVVKPADHHVVMPAN